MTLCDRKMKTVAVISSEAASKMCQMCAARDASEHIRVLMHLLTFKYCQSCICKH